MAGRGLGTLTLDLAVKTGMFTAGLDKAGRDLDKRAKAMVRTASQVGKAMGAALVAGATAFGYAVKQAIDQADQLNEISKKIGIPTDVLSGLNYAAKLSGVATEELQGGLVKMIKFQAEAAKGAKENVKVFSTLGIAIKDAGGNLRSSETVFEDFAEIFKRLPDGPEKTALALKVFGRAGAELIPLLNEGKSGLAGYADELDRLGGTVTPEAARAADEFNDNIDKLKVGFGGLALQVAADLLPELNKLTGEFVNNAKEGGAVSNTAHNIADGFRFMAEAASATVGAVQALTSYGIGLYEVMLKISSLNPGVALMKYFGVLKSTGSAGTAFDMGNEALFGTGKGASAAPNRAGSRARGGRGMGADLAPPPNISALFEEGTKGAKKHKEQVDQVAQAYDRMKAQMAETIALFNQTGEAAKVRYEIENGELAKLAPAKQQELLQQAQKIDQLNAEKIAREEMMRADEKAAEAAADHAKAVKELLEDLAFETSLTAMSNEEKERAIMLRQTLAGATAEEAKQITASVDALLEAQKANGELASAMDEFRGNFEDTVVDVVTGAKSIGEAFKSLADMVIAQIARIIAQQLTASLFGAPGSTGGGSGGGWLSSLFGMFTGGGGNSFSAGADGFAVKGFASGGNPPVGVPYLVGEHGPELRIDRSPSTIVPNGKLGGHSITVNINGSSDPRATAQQTANEVRRVLAFSGRSG